MRKFIPIVVVLCLLGLGGIYWQRQRVAARVGEAATIGERRSNVWNRLAQVREPLATLKYGDRVTVLEKSTNRPDKNEWARVRLENGLEGWVALGDLMDPEVARRAEDLRQRLRTAPVQARGRTRVLTNVRLEPGRSGARLFRFQRGQEVEILERAVAERPAEAEPAPPGAASQEPPAPRPESTLPRREDWLLVRGQDADAGEIAGWVRGSFLEPAIPSGLLAYAQGFRFVAWFELNRVPESDKELVAEPGESPESAASKAKMVPQYLVAGIAGGEGRPCDFDRIRFFTWNAKRGRYETAYVESFLCGRLPLRVTPAPAAVHPEKAEAAFEFANLGRAGQETRAYRMKQNIVRRVRK